jgi:RNA 3'-terminal phosphate cyclase
MAWVRHSTLRDVWLAAVTRMGVDIEIELRRSGWFPVGQGEIRAQVRPGRSTTLRPLQLIDRGGFVW